MMGGTFNFQRLKSTAAVGIRRKRLGPGGIPTGPEFHSATGIWLFRLMAGQRRIRCLAPTYEDSRLLVTRKKFGNFTSSPETVRRMNGRMPSTGLPIGPVQECPREHR